MAYYELLAADLCSWRFEIGEQKKCFSLLVELLPPSGVAAFAGHEAVCPLFLGSAYHQ